VANEIKHVDRERWAQTSVQVVMRPLSQLRTIAPDTPAIQAVEIMSREDVNQLPVLFNGQLEGIFSRWHILTFLQNHAELYRR
jgi:CBS domain-containing protein